jgi:hypothetical protein
MNRIAADDLTPAEQEAERLLTAFFEHEVPQPWPAFEPPARTLPFRPAAPRRRRSLLGSKVALAASVALLMACGWLLSGGFEGPVPSGGPFVPKNPVATKPELPDDVPMPMPFDMNEVPGDQR